LVDKGFYTTCCTCDNHYSIAFTQDATNSMESSGRNYIFNIGVDGVTTADELLQRIIDGTNNGYPLNHYTKLEADFVNKKLIIYDDRSNTADPTADPVTGAANPDIVWQNWDNPQFYTTAGGSMGTFGPGTAYTKEDLTDLQRPTTISLQIGADAGQKMDIDLPSASSVALGVTWVDASTVEGAWNGITAFKEAVHYVNKERSRMGAYQNRLEYTIRNLDNVVENTQAAEATLRDTDMADMMVKYSNEGIISQAAIAMMTQANQSKQGVLSLLQ